MLLLSAVSCGVALSTTQSGITTPLSPALAKVAEERTLTLTHLGVVLGQAVFVSTSGYAITPGEVAFGPDGTPRTNLLATQGNDTTIPIKVEAYDAVSDLTLIRVPLGPGQFTKPAELSAKMNSSVVLAMLATGASRAQVTRTGVAGVIGLSRRYMPLTEVRMEGVVPAISGAPLFAPDGHLCGVLMASLSGGQQQNMASDASPAGALEGSGTKMPAPALSMMGPQASSTAFAIDLPILRRVVAGFLSESREVKHPWVGLFFSSAPNGGALITQVVPGGPAGAAGLEVGDIIVQAAGKPAPGQLDLAAILFDQSVGAPLIVSYTRNGETKQTIIKVGTEPRAKQSLRRISPAIRSD